MQDSRCAIVIATYNRRARCEATLRELTALPERPPIVVVDNGSTDGTAAALAAAFPRVDVIPLETNIGAAARNIGAARAKTPYVAFCDDDCRWEAGAIRRAVALLDAYPTVAAINARVVVNGARTDAACERMACSPLPKASACPGSAIAMFMAGAVVMRRAAFLRAGGYHERYFLGAEESLLAIDLLDRGWELIYAPEIVVHHAPERSGRAPRRRRIITMRNRLWTAWLRLSPRGALRATAALARSARCDTEARAALRAAFGGLGWVVRERRPARRYVESLLDTLRPAPG